MKSKILTLIVTVLTLTLGGCTQNNGHIGPLFGVWRLDTVTADGVLTMDGVTDDGETYITWAFQGDIICVQQNIPHHGRIISLGSWETYDDDTRIILDFTHHDDVNPAGTDQYKLPAAMLLTTPWKYYCRLDLSGRHMTVSTSNTDGTQVKFTLTKTY